MFVDFPFIIENLLAELFKLFFFSSSIFKTMQSDFNSFFVKRFEFAININCSTVIGGKRNVKGDYMDMLIQEIITLLRSIKRAKVTVNIL